MFFTPTNKHICFQCVGDVVLQRTIQDEGIVRQCSYCGFEQAALPLEELADTIHNVLQEHFELTPDTPAPTEYVGKEDTWERDGAEVRMVIFDMADVSEEIAEDIRAHLSERFGYEARKDGEEDPYDSDAHYEARTPDDYHYRDRWTWFRDEIRRRGRFFNQTAKDTLDEIFAGVDELTTYAGDSVVKVIGPGYDLATLYRARVAFSEDDMTKYLTHPVWELGPPQSRYARAGRMNAEGISVFYGALEAETCVAEVRAPVGSFVVVGSFTPTRALRLLDFNALTEVYVKGSHFDEKFHEMRKKAAFLGRMVREISRPVMPSDEAFEYLPTQVIAEYLVEYSKPKFDGILFQSAQTDGCNVVLFHHASEVEPYKPPQDTETKVYFSDRDDDAELWWASVYEKTDEPEGEGKPDEAEGYRDWRLDDPDIEWPEDRNPTLRLDVKHIQISRVQRVKYKCREIFTSRDRLSKRDSGVL